jgi:DNA-damage-inducible protein J
MMAKTMLSVNIDANLKDETAEMLKSLGMDITTAITVYFNQIVRKRRIPFEISDSRYYSAEEVAGENWREGLEDIPDEWE